MEGLDRHDASFAMQLADAREVGSVRGARTSRRGRAHRQRAGARVDSGVVHVAVGVSVFLAFGGVRFFIARLRVGAARHGFIIQY